MIKYSKYYDGIFNRIEVDKNVDIIRTHFYDRWTGEYKKWGSPFKETVRYKKTKVELIRLEYQRENVMSYREYFICWKGEKLSSIRDISKESTYITNFEYNELGLLISEIRNIKHENELSFWDGSKYEYENAENVFRLKKIKKLVNVPTESEFQEIFGGEVIYDRFGRIKEEILPIHSRDPQFDHVEKKLIMKFSYRTKLGITEVNKTYSDSENIYDTQYFKERNGVKYYTKDLTGAQAMEFDNHGNLIRIGDVRLNYKFDKKQHWIKKFEDEKLTEEREIIYKKRTGYSNSDDGHAG